MSILKQLKEKLASTAANKTSSIQEVDAPMLARIKDKVVGGGSIWCRACWASGCDNTLIK